MRDGSISIGTMTAADVPDVARIEDPARMTEEQLREELTRPFARVWVARDSLGAIVAFLVAWHVADELHILNVATSPPHRRRGFARALLSATVAFSREKHVRHVLLEVRRSNRPAIALYRSMGFFAMGVRLKYYPDGEDAVEMWLAMDPETGSIVKREDEVRLED
jgi:ribosomal-protein-alanine N-acetyltransferase